MTKQELKFYADLFGRTLPIGKVKDIATRREIILLAASLSKPAREIEEELQEVQRKLTEGHEDEVGKWAELMAKGEKDEADKLAEAVRINKEYGEAAGAILAEGVDVPIRRIGLPSLIDALLDAEIIRSDASVEAIAREFKDFIEE